MEIVLTGTGSPLPDANRAGPSTLVKAGDTHILVDAGRGTVIRLTGAGSLPAFLGAVLVTHLHSDHVCALNDVITTHWIMTQGNGTLPIYGPPGIAQFVERQLHALEPDIGYRIEHHEALTNGPRVAITELAPGDSFDVGDVRITTAATVHAPVKPTIGYRLEHEGTTAAVVGDTIPCQGVDILASGVDAYVQTVIRRDLVEQIPNEMFQDILDYHSGVIDAAETATRAGAKRLVLTHLVPAPTPDQYPEWIARAADHFDGEIVIGDDLTTITIEDTASTAEARPQPMAAHTIDTIPVAKTPSGGWTRWPASVLAGCHEPRPVGAPDLDGYWRTIEVIVDGDAVPGHPALGHVQRIEQQGDRVVVTGGGIIHDMRCDGTLEHGVHDVAEFDKTTEIHVIATYEDGVHVLRPQGLGDNPIEVRRRREGPQLVWDYLGYTARLEHLAPSEIDPSDIGDPTDVAALRETALRKAP